MVEESVMCNPSTGQSFTIPRMKTRKRAGIVHILGYDPVEKLHKVLGMISHRYGRTMEHQVLTLGGTERATTWRMTECGVPCKSSLQRQNICVNGVFYYIETVTDGSGDHVIVCFDVGSEKYSFVKPPKRKLYHQLLDCNDVSTSVHGLVCVRISGHRFVNGRRLKVEESVICNPSTGQSFTIPRTKTRKRVGIVRFVVYDPVEKQHKNICISGVFYYIEPATDGSGDHMIFCFHVGSEKYSSVKPPKRKLHHWLLDCNDVVDPEEWFRIIGVTGPNEFVMSSEYSADPFQVYYCNFDKETLECLMYTSFDQLLYLSSSKSTYPEMNRTKTNSNKVIERCVICFRSLLLSSQDSFLGRLRTYILAVSVLPISTTIERRFVNGRRLKVEESVICNPSTGQSFTIPRTKTRKRVGIVRFVVYDPVEKQHKVLGMIWLQGRRTMEHQVLTLGGSEKAPWKMAECGIPCPSPYVVKQNICISGVFYYIEPATDGSGDHMIFCFHVGSEKYSSVKPRNYIIGC
ncbi:hypothetical protein Bca52824_067410 [Brassica carinata]|uniref:F-box associated beta-propeller type 3 domain-containing protein n=1 Tax=Brassica carinata TaxID=52824 RepID=A0A8X7QLX0_BRACI|nr:hypothetical protein Bca52824_067410 [Brassica carinata]